MGVVTGVGLRGGQSLNWGGGEFRGGGGTRPNRWGWAVAVGFDLVGVGLDGDAAGVDDDRHPDPGPAW